LLISVTFTRSTLSAGNGSDEQSYADLVALCQFLPGPASSQVSIAIGIARAGLPGGFAAWLGFTFPSALALIAFAFGIGAFAGSADAGWLHGLKIVAVAVVAQAVWGMARSLCPDRERATLAILASIVTLSWPTAVGQLLSIAVAGLLARYFLRHLLLHSRTCGFQLKKGQELRLGLSF
jgi:chromate transporter